MKFALLQVIQNWHQDLTDQEMYQGEIEMAINADKLGFDSLWTVEHHFEPYGMCPDNMQWLSYIAARTERIKLVPGAIILPWNDPLRVIEKMSMLQAFAPGRVGLGVGRGLAKSEYRGMRQDMNESRQRFDEAAEMILRGLETGIGEGKGEFYKQPAVDIRPKPAHSYYNDLHCVAMSPDSAMAAADLGATMMTFIQHEFSNHVAGIEAWRDRFRGAHPDVPVPPVMLTDVTLCHEDEEEAERMAHEYIGQHFASVMEHYDFAGDHFKDTKGYEAYQQGADLIKAAGMENARTAYINAQNWGTPEQIVEKYAERQKLIGEFNPMVVLSYANMSFAESQNSLRLFAEKVKPLAEKLTKKTPASV